MWVGAESKKNSAATLYVYRPPPQFRRQYF